LGVLCCPQRPAYYWKPPRPRQVRWQQGGKRVFALL